MFRAGMILLAYFSTSSFCLTESPESWTRFRGPNGSGVIEKSRVPLPWKPSDVRWEMDLPGEGNGSPVIWNGRVYVLSGDPESATRYVICGDLETGKVIWKKDYATKPHALHKFSSYGSSTPCVDEKLVYVAWASDESLTVKAFTHDGEEVWTRDFGRYVSQHGFGTSPILVDGKLILYDCQDVLELPPGVEPGKSRMLALDPATGTTLWETPRTATRVCYGVPCVKKDDQGRTVILDANTGDGFFAIDASNGKPLWNKVTFDKRVCSSAVLAGDLLIGTQGSGGGGNILVAMQSDGSGKEVFRITKAAPYVPTPVVLGDLAFLWADNGIVSCIELPSGKVIWTERVGGNVASSPIIVAGRLIGISDDGAVTIMAASRAPQQLGRIELNALVRSTPAADQDHLLIRTSSKLICIGAKK